nr:FAD-binding oxidoreductase [Bacteriovorax sp. HI3]
MDLHSSENFWPIKNGLLGIFPSLNQSLKCDIAIMGAGISGALMADTLCKMGLDVILVDKRHCGFGSTAASTALIQYEIDTPLRELIKKRGVDHAVQSYKLCVEAIAHLEALAKKYPQAGFKRRPSFQFTSSKSHLSDHIKEEELRRLYHISDTEWLTSQDIKKRFSFNKLGGIFSKHGAVLDPFQLTYSLISTHIKNNLRVFDNTTVLDIVHHLKSVTLKCSTGFNIEAKKLIIACGYESQKYLPKKVEIPKTTYAILSEVMDEKLFWHQESLIWETAEPYLYLRTTNDKRILIGGKDDPSHNPRRRDMKLPMKQKALEENFKQLYPHIPFKTDFSWAGIFCGTKDGLPYIGSIPERRNTYFSLGFGGNGITYSLIAAHIIADLIREKSNENVEIFAFNRH